MITTCVFSRLGRQICHPGEDALSPHRFQQVVQHLCSYSFGLFPPLSLRLMKIMPYYAQVIDAPCQQLLGRRASATPSARPSRERLLMIQSPYE
jgi:hypothetical protein